MDNDIHTLNTRGAASKSPWFGQSYKIKKNVGQNSKNVTIGGPTTPLYQIIKRFQLGQFDLFSRIWFAGSLLYQYVPLLLPIAKQFVHIWL